MVTLKGATWSHVSSAVCTSACVLCLLPENTSFKLSQLKDLIDCNILGAGPGTGELNGSACSFGCASEGTVLGCELTAPLEGEGEMIIS